MAYGMAAPTEGDDDTEPELDALERYLAEAEILTWGGTGLDGGHPEKHTVVLAGGVLVLVKPALPGVEAVPGHEAAGWRIARALGFTGLVAATVVRDVPRLTTGDPIKSSVQVIWPDAREWLTPIERLSAEDIWAAGVFDAIVAHADHATNNWFGVPDASRGGEPRLCLVDTGNAFGSGSTPPNSTFYSHLLGEALPGHLVDAVQRMCYSWPIGLEELLDDDEANGVLQRAKLLAESAVLRLG